MSKDIRSFFIVKPQKTGQQKQDLSTKKPVLKLGPKKRPIIIDSDSDEEPSRVNTKRSKPSVEAKKLNSCKKPEAPVTKSKYFESHCINVTDIFDKTPVKRDTSRKIIKRIVTKEDKETHFDKDFEDELAKLDYTLNDPYFCKGEGNKVGEETHIKEENSVHGLKETPTKKNAEGAKYINRESPHKNKSNVDYSESPNKKLKLEDKGDDCVTKEEKNKDNKLPTLNGSRKDSPIKNVVPKISSLEHLRSPSKSSLINKEIRVKTSDKSPYKKDSQINNAVSKISLFKKSPSKYARSDKAPSINGKLKTPKKSPYKKLSLIKEKTDTFKNEGTKLTLDISHAKNSDILKTEVTVYTKESPKKRVEKDLPNKINDRYEKKDSTANEVTDGTERKKSTTKNEISDKTEKKDPSPTVKAEGKPATTSSVPSNLWVERYKPTVTKQIIGQQGEKSCVNKLISWLNSWEKNHSGAKKVVKPSPWAKNDDGAFFKAALLSGPPGVGKTTTAHLVCKELGFDIVEFNASDTRSKRLLHEEVSELLSTKSLSPYFTGKGDQVTKKHVLLMDEVDGMAGNEDRGGVQELISLIRQSRVPVVCMCNDRNHPKIRSLANYCFDLRFSKPRVEQIRGAMMSVCFKEKLKLKPDELSDIITSANQDIRLIMNHLSMLSMEKTSMANSTKHIKLGPWDIVRKIFSEQDHKSMSIHDKCDLFFHDYNVTPLFVQENYLNAVPHKPEAKNKIKKMELFAKAATSLSFGDLTEKSIRSHNAWGLLPVQAVFSSLVPGAVLEGHLGAQIAFPAWFGKNSRQTKMGRLVQELTVHSRLKVSGNREAMNLDYLTSLGSAITSPLLRDGAEGVVTALSVLSEYCLVREDMESIAELSTWPGCKNRFAEVESKVKAAFTRAYNKTSAPTPYAAVPIKKGRGDVDTSDGIAEEDESGTPDVEDEEDGLEADSMIMVKKKPAGKKADKDVQPSTTKGSKTSKRGRKK